MQDMTDSINWLKQQPYVDGERVGIWGWSYGGYMTSYALTHSKLFKVRFSS
jgi:dipeptidyl-peptidase-4